jgi:hypothetical protein
MRDGIGSSPALQLLHWQFASGQPHVGQIRPAAVE